MSVRKIIALGSAVLIILIFIVLSRKVAVREEPQKREVAQTVKRVEVLAVKNEDIQTRIPLYGRLIAFEKTEIFSEVSGMLLGKGKTLRPGMRVVAGEELLRMDSRELELSIKAQRATLLSSITQILPDIKIDFPENLSTWEDYRRNFKLDAELDSLPAAKSARERDFIALKSIYNQYYSIKSAEDKLRKYRIYAPFSGEISESMVNTGTYIRAGQKLATLMNSSSYELEASVPLSDLSYIKIGQQVALSSEDFEDKTWTGRISRISNSIDAQTQTVKVYIQVSGSNLRENMFLSGHIQASTLAKVVEVPRTLLMNGKQVFYVRDSVLDLYEVQPVKIGEQTVLLRGLPDGLALLRVNFPGAFVGMRVDIASSE